MKFFSLLLAGSAGVMLAAIARPVSASESNPDPIVLSCVMDNGAEEFFKWEDEKLWFWVKSEEHWGYDPGSAYAGQATYFSRSIQKELSDGYQLISWHIDRQTGAFKREETLLTRGGQVFSKWVEAGSCGRSNGPAAAAAPETLF